MSGLSEENLGANYEEDGLLNYDGGARLIDLPGCTSQLSPNSSRVEEDSIQINVNRESLKRKLLLRRTLPELVDQGILPPLNVPPAYADRQRHLQRAQTGDRLRQKLKERPDRECLVQHHILEDTSVLVDRSLQDKQRLLKRSRLQSDLSGRLASRPGPLELIAKNILQTDPQLKDGLIEGKIHFTKTTEVDDPVRRLYHPDLYHADEDDFGLALDSMQLGGPIDFSALISSDDSLTESICLTPTEGSSEHVMLMSHSVSSPLDSLSVMSPNQLSAPNIPPAPDITPLLTGRKFHIINPPQLPPAPVFSFAATRPPAMPLSSNISQVSSSGDLTVSSLDGPASTSVSSSSSSTSRRTVKKPKNKNVTKSKMIKFHEYKGPPNAVKTIAKSRVELPREQPGSTSTSYGVLLEQQQLFLQWQLEYQQQTLLSRQQSESGQSTAATSAAAQMSFNAAGETAQPTTIGSSTVFSFRPSSSAVSAASKPSSRLEDLKVADLRFECKRLNLPSHGSKPHLIERLTPHLSKINFNAGQARESIGALRNSDSSLSGSSELTSPVGGSLESSFTGSQFGILTAQKPVAPVSSDVVSSRPPSILPMDVDPGANQSGFLCPAPATFILVQAGPQLSQIPQKMTQIPGGDVSRKDQVRPQIFSVARPAQVPSNGFSSSQMSGVPVAQPVMLLAHPLGAGAGSGNVIKSEDQKEPLTAKPPLMQSVQTAPHTTRAHSDGISSEEMVIRQRHVIASLEQSLQKYQEQLLLAQQKAFIQQIQLSSLAQDGTNSNTDEKKTSTNAFVFTGQKDDTAASLSSSNGVCNQALLDQSKLEAPYDLNTNGNGTVPGVGHQVPPYKPLAPSTTDPLLPVASLYTNSVGIGSYPNLPVSESCANPMQSSQCSTLDDIIDIIRRKGELMLPMGDDTMFASNLKESSELGNVGASNYKPMFFLPDSEGHDLVSGHPMNSSVFSADAFPFDSKTISSSHSLPPQYSRCNDVQKMDLCGAKSDASCANGNFDAIGAGGIFPLGNMEWSDLDLDLMNSQMDVGQSSLDNAYRSNKNFDLDLNGVNWLSRNCEAAPSAAAAVTTTCPSQSATAPSAAPYSNCEYLPLFRPGEDLGLFNYDESDPFATSDLSMMMNFDTFVDAQTSKI